MAPALNSPAGAVCLLAVGAAAFALGLVYARRQYYAVLMMEDLDGEPDEATGTGRSQEKPLEVEKLAELHEDFRMVLVVRNDLKMGKGKIAAQCGHATLGLYKKLLRRAPLSLYRWEESAQVKVVTKVESEEELNSLQKKAASAGVPTHVTVDAGRTQIAPNSRTVMAILGPDEIIADITGHLKLL